jgi:hypothetical protein
VFDPRNMGVRLKHMIYRFSFDLFDLHGPPIVFVTKSAAITDSEETAFARLTGGGRAW